MSRSTELCGNVVATCRQEFWESFVGAVLGGVREECHFVVETCADCGAISFIQAWASPPKVKCKRVRKGPASWKETKLLC